MMEPTYRRQEIPAEPWTHEDNPDWIWIEGPNPYMLAPDSRLQAIADAWSQYSDQRGGEEAVMVWEGTDLWNLLDALKGTDDE